MRILRKILICSAYKCKLNISSGRVGSVKHETAIGTGQPVQRKDIPMLFEEPPYLCFLPAPTLSQRFQSQDAPESTVLHDRCKKREGVPIVLIGGMTPQIKPCIRFIENSLSVCQPLRNVPRQASDFPEYTAMHSCICCCIAF